MNRIPLRYRFRKITASPLNKDFKLNLLYCSSPQKYRQEKKLTYDEKDISLFPFLQSQLHFLLSNLLYFLGKDLF